VVAVALGLAASITWGAADFIGGLKSRTLDLLAVLAVSQVVALALLAVATAVRGEGPPSGESLVYAAAAGAGGVLGLACFYRGLAVGTMSVVAPIAGLGAVLPVAVGVAGGDRPGGLQSAGVVLALAGVVLASREPSDGAAGTGGLAPGAGLALLAALGFGTFLVFMDSAGDGDVLWALLVARLASVALLAAAVAAARPALPDARRHLPALVTVGILDLSANSFYTLAAGEGLVSLAAVLSSLYPVATIVMARLFLGERVRRGQALGVGLVLLAVGAIAGGSA
jgi:drug/metabolite transporter (DMT)-like permease